MPASPAPDGNTPSSASQTLGGGTCFEHGSPECPCTTTSETWDDSLTPWLPQRRRIHSADGVHPTLPSGGEGRRGHGIPWIFSAEDSHVRTSPSPDSGAASPENAPASSTSSPASLGLFDLDGYSSRTYPDLGWRVLDSRFFGVPQRRRRVFVVGALVVDDPRAAAERAGQVLAVGSRCPGHPATRGEAGADVAVASLSGLGNGGPDDNDGQAGRLVTHALTSAGADASEDGTGRGTPLVSYALNGKHGNRDDGESETFNLVTGFSHTQGIDAQPSADAWPTLRSEGGGHAGGIGASVRRLTPTECERLQGLEDGWTNPDGTAPDSRRYAGLGDAVTATVGHWIGDRLYAADEVCP